jgi:hypothetical protein
VRAVAPNRVKDFELLASGAGASLPQVRMRPVHALGRSGEVDCQTVLVARRTGGRAILAASVGITAYVHACLLLGGKAPVGAHDFERAPVRLLRGLQKLRKPACKGRIDAILQPRTIGADLRRNENIASGFILLKYGIGVEIASALKLLLQLSAHAGSWCDSKDCICCRGGILASGTCICRLRSRLSWGLSWRRSLNGLGTEENGTTKNYGSITLAYQLFVFGVIIRL